MCLDTNLLQPAIIKTKQKAATAEPPPPSSLREVTQSDPVTSFCI